MEEEERVKGYVFDASAAADVPGSTGKSRTAKSDASPRKACLQRAAKASAEVRGEASCQSFE